MTWTVFFCFFLGGGSEMLRTSCRSDDMCRVEGDVVAGETLTDVGSHGRSCPQVL